MVWFFCYQTAITVLIGTKFDEFVRLPPDLQWTIVTQVWKITHDFWFLCAALWTGWFSIRQTITIIVGILGVQCGSVCCILSLKSLLFDNALILPVDDSSWVWYLWLSNCLMWTGEGIRKSDEWDSFLFKRNPQHKCEQGLQVCHGQAF